MGKKLIIRAASLAAALVTGIACSSSASAFSLMGHRLKDCKAYYYFESGIDAKTIPTFVTACENWRYRTNLYEMERLGNEEDVVKVCVDTISGYPVMYSGLTGTWKKDGYLTKATITFNTYHKAWSDDNARLSVAAHEIGHVFGLNDLDGARALMNGVTYGENSRYETYGITDPQADDICGIGYLFNSGILGFNLDENINTDDLT